MRLDIEVKESVECLSKLWRPLMCSLVLCKRQQTLIIPMLLKVNSKWLFWALWDKSELNGILILIVGKRPNPRPQSLSGLWPSEQECIFEHWRVHTGYPLQRLWDSQNRKLKLLSTVLWSADYDFLRRIIVTMNKEIFDLQMGVELVKNQL